MGCWYGRETESDTEGVVTLKRTRSKEGGEKSKVRTEKYTSEKWLVRFGCAA